MLFVLFALFSSALFASDLKRDISLTSKERDRLKKNHAAQVLVAQTDIDFIKENNEIRNECFFTCNEHTMHIAEATKWF